MPDGRTRAGRTGGQGSLCVALDREEAKIVFELLDWVDAVAQRGQVRALSADERALLDKLKGALRDGL